jgi:hypothetical protein
VDYNYTYTYPVDSVDPTNAVASAAFIGVLLFFVFILFIASYAIGAFLLGRIFKKADTPQWIAWVPVYNTWKMLEIGGQQGFWSILLFIPIVNIVAIVFTYIAMYNIGLKLGKDDWFVLLAIFLPLIWMIWLAFDDSTWAVEKKAAPTKTKTAPAKKTTRKKSA